MSQKDAKAKIRKQFLEDFKKLTKSTERIKFLKTLIDHAEELDLESYSFFFRGYQKWVEKNFAPAIECFEKAIVLDDTFAYPWNGLGNVYSAKKDYDKAIEAYNKSIALDDKLAHAYRNIALCFRDDKRYKEAEKNFKIALSLFKEAGDHYFVSITESNIEETQSLITSDNALKAEGKYPSIDPIAKILKETIDKKIEEKA